MQEIAPICTRSNSKMRRFQTCQTVPVPITTAVDRDYHPYVQWSNLGLDAAGSSGLAFGRVMV
jgi:hypothetical protein